MKGYAYRDQYGILHIVEDYETAVLYAVGEIKEVDCEYGGGFLKIDGHEVYDYGNGEVYIDGNKNNGIHVNEFVKENPEVVEKLNKFLSDYGL